MLIYNRGMRSLVLMALVACGSGGSDTGEVGAACYPNGTCNVGLSCFQGSCVPADAAFLDAAIDAAIDAPVSPGCADDSAFEPNESVQNPFQTPIDGQALMVSFAGLAICPTVADKDVYRVAVSPANANKAVEVIVTWSTGPALVMSIQNAGGTSIANGVAMGTSALRACVPNLPAGSYFAAVAAGLGPNNYSMTIKLLANCTN